MSAMKNGDYETALSTYSQAVTLDSANEAALVGHAALNIASVVTDPELAAVMANNVGLSGYPAAMADVLNPNTWTKLATLDGTPTPVPNIHIKDETDYDQNGVIDFDDWAKSLVRCVATHNAGLDFILKTLSTILGARVDSAYRDNTEERGRGSTSPEERTVSSSSPPPRTPSSRRARTSPTIEGSPIPTSSTRRRLFSLGMKRLCLAERPQCASVQTGATGSG